MRIPRNLFPQFVSTISGIETFKIRSYDPLETERYLAIEAEEDNGYIRITLAIEMQRKGLNPCFVADLDIFTLQRKEKNLDKVGLSEEEYFDSLDHDDLVALWEEYYDEFSIEQE